MPQSLKAYVALIAVPLMISAEQPRLVTADEATKILHGGVQVRIGTHDKRTISGKPIQATADGVTVQTGNRKRKLP